MQTDVLYDLNFLYENSKWKSLRLCGTDFAVVNWQLSVRKFQHPAPPTFFTLHATAYQTDCETSMLPFGILDVYINYILFLFSSSLLF